MRDLHLGGGQSLVSQFAGLKLRDSVADMANRAHSRLNRLKDRALASKTSAMNTPSVPAATPALAANAKNTQAQGSDTGEP